MVTTPIALDAYRGPRRGIISNRELIVTDDTSDPNSHLFKDITLGWTNTLRDGSGRDRIVAVDGTRDVVACGSGRDTALVDSRDSVRGCERVERR